jgi:predicted enzyme related to lactoylglutathione lyase
VREARVDFGMNFNKLVVGDLERVERFYAAVGLKTVQRYENGEGEVHQKQVYMSVTGDTSSHQLILCRFVNYPPPPRPEYPGECWQVFNVTDVDETIRTMEAYGGGVFRAPQDRPEAGVRAAVVHDPEGHYIELVGPMAGD